MMSVKQNPEKMGWLWDIVLGCALIFPLLMAAGIIVWRGIPDRLLDGDAALLEISTQAVLDGEQFTGPYSRNWFNHPGPTYFYLLAPLYALMQGRALSLYLTAVVINIAALLGAISIIQAMTTRYIALWSALLLAIYCRQLGGALYDIWNPWITILPFIVAVLAFAAAANGTFWFFPVGIAVASFVVQTHLGYTLVIAGMAAYALVLELCPPLRRTLGLDSRRNSTRRLAVLGVSLAVAVVLWAAPILEEIWTHPGNLTKILAFFAQSTPEISWGQTWQTFQDVFSYFKLNIVSPDPLLMLLEPEDSALRIEFIVFVQSALLLIAWILARRWKCQYLASLALVNVVVCSILILSIHRIVGDLLAYLVAWMTASGVLCWVVIGGVFSHILTAWTAFPFRKYLCWAGMLLLVSGFLTITIISSHRIFTKVTDEIANKDAGTVTPQLLRITTQTLNFLASHNLDLPVLRTMEYHLWPAVAGLGLQFTKHRQAAAIDPQYPTSYPSRYALTGEEEGMLLIATSRTAVLLKNLPDMQMIAEVDDRAVFWRSFADGLNGEYAFELLPAFAKTYQGFSEPGYNPDGLSYRWATASESSLEIPLSPHEAHQIAVSITIRQPVRDVEILFNQQKLLTISGPQEWGWREFVLNVPADYARPLNTIIFRYLYDTASDQNDLNEVRRAVAFKSLSVKKSILP